MVVDIMLVMQTSLERSRYILQKEYAEKCR